MSATVLPMRRPSLARLACTTCGAETDASCNCGAPYVPAAQRAADAIAENPEKSNRAIAEIVKVDEKTIRKARQRSTADSPQLAVLMALPLDPITDDEVHKVAQARADKIGRPNTVTREEGLQFRIMPAKRIGKDGKGRRLPKKSEAKPAIDPDAPRYRRARYAFSNIVGRLYDLGRQFPVEAFAYTPGPVAGAYAFLSAVNKYNDDHLERDAIKDAAALDDYVAYLRTRKES